MERAEAERRSGQMRAGPEIGTEESGGVGDEDGVSIETLMKRALADPEMLSLAAGFTDNAFLPREEVLALAGEVLGAPEAGEALQYGNPQGRPGLRRSVAERVRRLDRERGGDPGPMAAEDVIVTNGSQQALALAVRSLCRPGDAVLVESPTYFVFLDLLRELGVEPIALPHREDRLDADALPAFLKRLAAAGDAERVRAVYLMGYFANPTGYSLVADAKRTLIDALVDAGLPVPVIEDAAYREFHFEDPWPAPSLLSVGGEDVPVIHTATFTKPFATGLKVGYMVVPDRELRNRLGALKRVSDFGTGNFDQALLERAVDDGIYDAFLRRMRPFYAGKARVLHEALIDAGLDDLGWHWEEARGGIYLWLKAPRGVRVAPGSPFYRACTDEKILYVPGGLCYADGTEGRVRLSFGNLGADRLPEAARRLGRAARGVAERRP